MKSLDKGETMTTIQDRIIKDFEKLEVNVYGNIMNLSKWLNYEQRVSVKQFLIQSIKLVQEETRKETQLNERDNFVLSPKELRQLLFWAEYGVGNAVGGSYQKTIIGVISKYAKYLMMESRTKNPKFGRYIDNLSITNKEVKK